MLRAILFSLLALVAVWFAAQHLGLTPEQVEDQVLLAELNQEAGIRYREENAHRGGVVELQGGLQVEVLRAGDGIVPTLDDWVEVHYSGWHVDGRLFETTHRLGLPGNVLLARTIPGWQQVLTEVGEGSVVRIVVPPELAYGRAGGGRIGPEETLIFELELLGVAAPPERQKREPLQQPVPGLEQEMARRNKS